VTEHHFGDVGRGAVRIACLDAGLDMLRAAIEDPARDAA
jgi:nicotinamide-nucleotide amidase